MNEMCSDNRFEVIARAKEHIIKSTNIEVSKDEMKCLDNFLFRCWQMGWLKQYESVSEIPNKCEKTQMVDKSTFSQDQYRADLQSAFDCGKASVQPCGDAISRQATVERLCKLAEFMNERRDGLGSPYIMAALFIQDNKEEFPPVTPKQKMGRWIREKKHHKDDFQEFDYWDVRCSECGARKRIGWMGVKYCPNCGAKMEGGAND